MRFLRPLLFLVVFLSGLSLVPTGRADESSDDAESRGFAQSPSSRDSLKRHSGETVDWWYTRALMPLVWNPDPNQPLTKIEIQLTACKLFVYQGDRVVGATSISCGKEGYDTRPGSFTITQKDKDHHSNMYGSFVDANGKVMSEKAEPTMTPPPGAHYEAAPMLWFLRITDSGTGMHAGYVTGGPASHGCIRLPPPFAEDLFSMAQVGTRVEVKP